MLKPAGTAILVGLVACAATAGIWYSGVLDQKPDRPITPTPSVVAAPPMPTSPAEVPVVPSPAPATEPAPTQAKPDAFDQLIRQSGKK